MQMHKHILYKLPRECRFGCDERSDNLSCWLWDFDRQE